MSEATAVVWPVVTKAQRVCIDCKRGYPDSNFFLNSNKRPRPVCKQCHVARTREWRRARA
jgi:hypothetical protein